MLGSRTKIALLSSFFTFAFAMVFLALAQNYVHAWSTSLSTQEPVRIVAATNTTATVEYDIMSSLAFDHSSADFDFDSDDSYQKYLNTDHPFTDSNYTPEDLLPIPSNFTANDARHFKLRKEAGIAFADMAWHFWNAFSGDRLYITSTYRSRGFQDFLIKQWCSLIKCAQIGTSEHQAWLALDLKVITKSWKAYSLDLNGQPNTYYTWLKDNAATFGFHNTYQKWVEIDGKIVEGRHRRYLWVELAMLLAERNQTFAEYYNSTNN